MENKDKPGKISRIMEVISDDKKEEAESPLDRMARENNIQLDKENGRKPGKRKMPRISHRNNAPPNIHLRIFPDADTRPPKKIELHKLDGTTEIIDHPKPEGLEDIRASKQVALQEVGHGFYLDQERLNKNKKLMKTLETRLYQKIGGHQGARLLGNKLMELVEGVQVLKQFKNQKGEVTHEYVYKEKPDLKAITYALDRVLGRPTSRVESLDVVEGVKTVEDIVRSQADASSKNKKAKKKRKKNKKADDNIIDVELNYDEASVKKRE